MLTTQLLTSCWQGLAGEGDPGAGCEGERGGRGPVPGVPEVHHGEVQGETDAEGGGVQQGELASQTVEVRPLAGKYFYFILTSAPPLQAA